MMYRISIILPILLILLFSDRCYAGDKFDSNLQITPYYLRMREDLRKSQKQPIPRIVTDVNCRSGSQSCDNEVQSKSRGELGIKDTGQEKGGPQSNQNQQEPNSASNTRYGEKKVPSAPIKPAIYKTFSLSGIIPISKASFRNIENRLWQDKEDQLNIHTFDAKSKYTGFNVGIGIGYNIDKSILKRIELTLNYLKLTSKVKINTDTVANPGSSFVAPSGWGNMNMFLLSGNIYFDPFAQRSKFYPTIGFGVGGAFIKFNDYINSGIIAPSFNGYLGFNYDIRQSITISLGYRIIYFAHNMVGGKFTDIYQIKDQNKVLGDNDPRYSTTILKNFMIHNVELSIRF